MGMQDGRAVIAETAYPRSVAAARVRIEAFAPHLAPLGVALHYRPALSEREYALITSGAGTAAKVKTAVAASTRLLARQRDGDALLVHRLRCPVPIPGIDPPRRLAVYDFDDALFIGSVSSTNRRFARLKMDAARCTSYMQRAQVVLAGNSYLAEHARRHCSRVEVIPSCVDPDKQPIRRHRETDVVTVGWIGSPSTSGYLDAIHGVLARLNERGVRMRLVVMGATTRIDAPWIEYRPWSLEGERETLAQLDIGLMPMPEDRWTRGKCGYKLLQYFSAGVPAVASPVGVNSTIVSSERGMLASTPRDWDRALTTLAASCDIRRQMGCAARAFVEREFSYQRWAPELAGLLRSV